MRGWPRLVEIDPFEPDPLETDSRETDPSESIKIQIKAAAALDPGRDAGQGSSTRVVE